MQAPDPMLPNYGAGQIRLYHLDLTMMMCFNTRERTITEMLNLGFVMLLKTLSSRLIANFPFFSEKAGLHALRVFDLAEMCLVEFSATN